MVFCAALGCTNRSKDNKRIKSLQKQLSWYSFPSNPELKAEWIAALKRDKWVPSLTAKLCSEHFSKDDFYVTRKRRLLTVSAVPSIFPCYPKRLPKVQLKRIKRDIKVTNTNEEDAPPVRLNCIGGNTFSKTGKRRQTIANGYQSTVEKLDALSSLETDEFDCIGRKVSIILRKLPFQKAQEAEDAINEVLRKFIAEEREVTSHLSISTSTATHSISAFSTASHSVSGSSSAAPSTSPSLSYSPIKNSKEESDTIPSPSSIEPNFKPPQKQQSSASNEHSYCSEVPNPLSKPNRKQNDRIQESVKKVGIHHANENLNSARVVTVVPRILGNSTGNKVGKTRSTAHAIQTNKQELVKKVCIRPANENLNHVRVVTVVPPSSDNSTGSKVGKTGSVAQSIKINKQTLVKKVCIRPVNENSNSARVVTVLPRLLGDSAGRKVDKTGSTAQSIQINKLVKINPGYKKIFFKKPVLTPQPLKSHKYVDFNSVFNEYVSCNESMTNTQFIADLE